LRWYGISNSFSSPGERLSLIAELVYGAKLSFHDPARYSFAHGGKDGHPYPVDREIYDGSIEILQKAIEQSKVERTEKMGAIKRLANFHLEPPYSLPL
jgi:hypothetical protein